MLLPRLPKRYTGKGIRGPYRIESGKSEEYYCWRVERVDYDQRDQRGKPTVIREYYPTEEEALRHASAG